VVDPPPFILTERADGLRELRAFSDASDDPIVLVLDDESGRRFGATVADILTSLDAYVNRVPITLQIDGRAVTMEGTSDRGLRLTVAPPEETV
jgi:hypothetical protein